MGLYPMDFSEYIALIGIPRSKNSQIYLVDPINGNDSATGRNINQALATLEEAEDRCVANQNDTVVLVGGPTGNALSAALAWDKGYTHLVGMSADLPGVGQRCRVTGSASADLTNLVTFSAQGCVVKNVQFFNGADADVDSGAVVLSGSRCMFENCFFAGMGHATPGARAGSYSLKVSGEENVFKDCAIGLDTVLRAAANAELALLSGAARNIFRHCRFLSYSETAGKFLVSVADGVDRWQEFEDCVFQNFSVNWATSLSNAIDMNATATHQIILRGINQLVGVTGWADVVTRLYSAAPAPDAGFGVAVQPTT